MYDSNSRSGSRLSSGLFLIFRRGGRATHLCSRTASGQNSSRCSQPPGLRIPSTTSTRSSFFFFFPLPLSFPFSSFLLLFPFLLLLLRALLPLPNPPGPFRRDLPPLSAPSPANIPRALGPPHPLWQISCSFLPHRLRTPCYTCPSPRPPPHSYTIPRPFSLAPRCSIHGLAHHGRHLPRPPTSYIIPQPFSNGIWANSGVRVPAPGVRRRGPGGAGLGWAGLGWAVLGLGWAGLGCVGLLGWPGPS